MTDINEEARAVLEKTGYGICYRYPMDFKSLPVVSYYLLSDKIGLAADNEELTEVGYICVDIWTRTPKEGHGAASVINRLMSGDGWVRQLAADVPRERGERVYHKTMRFKKVFMSI